MVEQTQAYSGLYFVLMGRLSPLDGIGPKEIRLERLLKRATDGVVREVVLATNFTNEGEATAHYIGELLRRARAQGERASRAACRSAASSNTSTAARWRRRCASGARWDRDRCVRGRRPRTSQVPEVLDLPNRRV